MTTSGLRGWLRRRWMTLVIRFRIRVFALPIIAKDFLAEDFRLLRAEQLRVRRLRLQILYRLLQGRNPVLERQLLRLQNHNTAMQAEIIRLKTQNMLAEVFIRRLEQIRGALLRGSHAHTLAYLELVNNQKGHGR